jgi:glycosyltransferase involved in cell wall biosynthesis
MRVAIVHELLTRRGGAENVARVLANMFPDAPVYTLLYDERKLGAWFPQSRVHTSRLQPWTHLTTNHHMFLPFFPRTVEAWDFSAFDIVISSSSAFAHGIITNGKPKHLCYVQSPARYLWDRTHDVLRSAPMMLRPTLSKTFHKLRVWDSEVADRPNALLAASRTVERRIELYWNRPSTVVHPPIDDQFLSARATPGRREGLVIVSQLVPYKRIELAIVACNERKLRLKIAGEGSAYRALQRSAGPTIQFLGYVDQKDLPSLYASAEATLFPGEEDFGLVPLESMACGSPVIAFRAGGALETVRDGVTGTFFDEQTPASLGHAIERCLKQSFDPAVLQTHARQFSRTAFETQIRTHVEKVMSE